MKMTDIILEKLLHKSNTANNLEYNDVSLFVSELLSGLGLEIPYHEQKWLTAIVILNRHLGTIDPGDLKVYVSSLVDQATKT